MDLWSNGIIWKSGVYREKSEIVISLKPGLCCVVEGTSLELVFLLGVSVLGAITVIGGF